MDAMRRQIDAKRYSRIVQSQTERMRYLYHAYDYCSHLAPDGDSRELDALVEASRTLELVYQHMVWGE
jgi:hypothetical protein